MKALTRPLTTSEEKTIKCALEKSWSEKTGAWNPNYPSSNQCIQTSFAVWLNFGGEILRTKVITVQGRQIDHFYNRIGGQRYDFTEDQFAQPGYWASVKYDDDLVDDIDDVKTLVYAELLDNLIEAFNTELKRLST